MSDSYPLRRRDTHPTWAWLVFGIIVLAMVLALSVHPHGTSRHLTGARGPSVRPQSDSRPMPPPSVARTRGLAA